MTRLLRASLALIFLIGLMSLSGCAGVKPWERETLARPDMAWDPDPQEAQRMNHVYFSKEGALRGGSASGGGCGCN